MTLFRCWTSPDKHPNVGLANIWHHFSPRGWHPEPLIRTVWDQAFLICGEGSLCPKKWECWILFCFLLNCPWYQTPMCVLASAASKSFSKRFSVSVLSALSQGSVFWLKNLLLLWTSDINLGFQFYAGLTKLSLQLNTIKQNYRLLLGQNSHAWSIYSTIKFFGAW